MSYRTYINGHEWLGNNEGPQVIFDELKRQGCKLKDGSVHNFQIKDLQGLIEATEKAIVERQRIFPKQADFTDDITRYKDCLTDRMLELTEGAYIFWSVALLKYVGRENYEIEHKEVDNDDCPYAIRRVYKLKKGAKCIFEAY